MSDNRFSSGSPQRGDARFDYFATPSAGAGSPFGGSPSPSTASGSYPLAAANPFGSSGTANPFGAPPAATNAFGTPGPAAGAAVPPGRKVHPVVLVLVSLVVLGGGWFGYRVYQHSRPVVMPASLGGLTVSGNPVVLRSVANAQNQLQAENPNIQLKVQAYGVDTNNRIVIAAALRGTTNTSNDLATFGNNVGTTYQTGNSVCATSPTARITVCERSSGDLTVLVASVTRAPAADMATVADLVDQVWSQV